MTEYPAAGAQSQTRSTLLCSGFHSPVAPTPAGHIDPTNRLLPLHSGARIPDHATAAEG